MKRRHIFLTMMMTLLLLLISVSAWAMPPVDGIYEKKDESGNVTARMFIITLDGKASETQEGLTMETSPGAPIIAMQALDGSGNVTEELATCYTWKTDTAGAGESTANLPRKSSARPLASRWSLVLLMKGKPMRTIAVTR